MMVMAAGDHFQLQFGVSDTTGASSLPNVVPFNDRAWLLEQKSLAEQQARTIDESQRYAMMGAGLALFCKSFLAAMEDREPPCFSREEAMQILLAAVEMR